MKEALNLSKPKLSKVRIDKSLNKYDDVVLFPDQVKRAREMFEQSGGVSKVKEAIRNINLNK